MPLRRAHVGTLRAALVSIAIQTIRKGSSGDMKKCMQEGGVPKPRGGWEMFRRGGAALAPKSTP